MAPKTCGGDNLFPGNQWGILDWFCLNKSTQISAYVLQTLHVF